MSFTSATFQVHTLFQNIFPLPYVVDTKRGDIMKNSCFKLKSKKWFRNLAISIWVFLSIFNISRLLHIFSNLLKVQNHLDEISMRTIFLCLQIMSLTNVYQLLTQGNTVQYLLSQCCKLQHFNYSKPAMLNISKYTAKQAAIYIVILLAPLTSLALIIAPFVTKWNLSLVIVKNSIAAKVVGSAVMGLVTSYMAFALVSTLTLFLSYMELIIGYSKTLRPRFGFEETCYFSNRQFYKSYKKFQTFHVISKLVERLSFFWTILVFVGTFLASVAGFSMLTLWHNIPITMYIASLAGFVVCCLIAILMTAYANIPRTNVVKFRNFWKLHTKSAALRKQLCACPLIGVTLEQYGLVTAKLGILICDDITRNIFSLLLMF